MSKPVGSCTDVPRRPWIEHIQTPDIGVQRAYASIFDVSAAAAMPEASLPITVPAEDPKKKEDKKGDATGKTKVNGDPKDDEEVELVSASASRLLTRPSSQSEQSEQDLQLRNELEMLVERLKA
jgi:hypothetical protein